MIYHFRYLSIFAFCLLGSIIRITYSYLHQPWLGAPDHLAWELVLEQGKFGYDYLIHYPHEGGSIIVSLLALVVENITSISSLTIVALLLDFIIRFVQIVIVQRLYNQWVTIAFGIWTLFATPIFIPWASVNFGLHYLSGVFPFILLYLTHTPLKTTRAQLILGAFLGVCIWFSYINVVAVLVFMAFQVINSKKIPRVSWSAFLAVVVIHVMVRLNTEVGFQIEQLSTASIRGASFNFGLQDFTERISNFHLLIGKAFVGLEHTNIFLTGALWTMLLLLIVGVLLQLKSKNGWQIRLFPFAIIVTFLLFYFISPFYNKSIEASFILDRHLTYIIPLLALFVIDGLSQSKLKPLLISTFISLQVIPSVMLFYQNNELDKTLNKRASGWVIGRKFGHSPEKVLPIISANSEDSQMLVYGIGWGISTAIIEDNADHEKVATRVHHYFSLYPENYQGNLFEGFQHSLDIFYPEENKNEIIHTFKNHE